MDEVQTITFPLMAIVQPLRMQCCVHRVSVRRGAGQFAWWVWVGTGNRGKLGPQRCRQTDTPCSSRKLRLLDPQAVKTFLYPLGQMSVSKLLAHGVNARLVL